MASRGRPPTGRSGDKPVTVYLPPEDIAALDRLADLRTVRTGKKGIRVRRDTSWHQPVSAMAWCRFRGRGNSSMCADTVSKRSGNVLLKKRDAGVVPSAA